MCHLVQIPQDTAYSPGRGCQTLGVSVDGLGGTVKAVASTIKGIGCDGFKCGLTYNDYELTLYEWWLSKSGTSCAGFGCGTTNTDPEALWSSSWKICDGTGGKSEVAPKTSSLTNTNTKSNYPTNYIGSWQDSAMSAMSGGCAAEAQMFRDQVVNVLGAGGPGYAGGKVYDANACRQKCPEFKWVGIQAGG